MPQAIMPASTGGKTRLLKGGQWDQSYFLCALNQDQLSRPYFRWQFGKREVRHAEEAGLKQPTGRTVRGYALLENVTSGSFRKLSACPTG